MEDEKKIEKILAKLNRGLKIPQWTAAEGFHGMPVVNFIEKGVPRVDSGSGLIVKVFVNLHTGEVRPYYHKNLIK